MNNKKFIEKYGKDEFYSLCKHIHLDLFNAKSKKKICSYKVHNRKKYVTFFLGNGKYVNIDFATIFIVGLEQVSISLKKIRGNL